MKSIEEQGPEPRLPGLTQYTPEQLFFVSFSQVSMILDFSKILISKFLFQKFLIYIHCIKKVLI